MQIGFPYQVDSTGRTAHVTSDDHIRNMIEQVLFTMPGERVNQPDFGSGLSQLLFGSMSDELVAATQFLIQGALQQWLGDLIQVEMVQVEHRADATLSVTIQYLVRRDQQRQAAQFIQSL